MPAGAHRFTGKPEDGATELYYFGTRYYDPEVGRFTSRDPAKDGLNWYDYCCQNPPVYVDPDGKHPWDAKRLLNQYRSDIVRISETYGIPPAALATVVYCENVRRSYISELKDEAAILGLIMEGHDASIGICQVKFSTALMLDFGYPPKRLAEDPVTCMDYAARYLAFLAEAREYKSPELWLSDYNRGLSEYTDPTAYGEQYRKVARRYGFRAE